MPIYKVEAPNGSILQLEGPEGASEQDIIQAATELYSGAPAQSTEQPSATAGPIEALIGGTKRFGSSAITGITAPFGAEKAAIKGIQRQEGITERPGASLEAVKQTYNQDGLLSAVGEVFSQVPSAVTEQAPFLASMWAGAKTGAMLPVPPQFKPITAIGGALIAPFLVQSGSNIERQAQEQLQEGEDINVKLGRAYATAAVQASLDVLSMKLGMGKLLGLKPAALGTEAAEKAAQDAVKKISVESALRTTGIGAAKTIGAEVPTEMFQQLLERAQAGLSLTDDDAMKEYMDAAYGAGLLAPLGSVSRTFEKADARKTIAEQEEKANQLANRLKNIQAERTRIDKIAQDAKLEAIDRERTRIDAIVEDAKGKAKEREGEEKVTNLLSTPEGTNELILDLEEALKTKKPSKYFQGLTKQKEKEQLLKDLKSRKGAFEDTYADVFAGAPAVTTDDTWANLGIGKSAKIRKSNELNGLDVNIVEDNKKIRTQLENYLKFPGLSAKIEEQVSNYLDSIPTIEQLEAQNVQGRSTDIEPTGDGNGLPLQTREGEYVPAPTNGNQGSLGTSVGGGLPGAIRGGGGEGAVNTALEVAPYKGSTLRNLLNKIKIAKSDMLDIMGEPKSPKRIGYYFGFQEGAPTLISHIESGRLDKFLPRELRLSETSADQAYDAGAAYDWIAERMRAEEEVIPYEEQVMRDEAEQQVSLAEQQARISNAPLTDEEINAQAQIAADEARQADLEQAVIEPPPVEPIVQEQVIPVPRPGRRPLTPEAKSIFIQPEVKVKTVKPGAPTTPPNSPSGGDGTVFNDPDNEPENIEKAQKTKSRNFLDWFETRFLSSDAALNNGIRRGMQKMGVPWKKFKEILYKASTAQVLHSENVAHQVLEVGGVEYDPVTMKFKATENTNGSWLKMVNVIRAMAKTNKMDYEQMEEITNLYLEAKRLEGVRAENARIDAEVLRLTAAGAKKEDIKKLEDQKKYVHLSDEEINTRVAYVSQYAELREVQSAWNATRESLLAFAVESGLFSKEQAQELLDAMDYVPFYRIQEEQGDVLGPKEYSRGLLDFADPKRFKGSKRPVNNIVDNMERWISYTIRRGIANKAAINLKNAAIEYLPDEVREVKGTRKGRNQNIIKIRENTIENGVEVNREHFYEFDDPLYIHAFTGMEAILIPALKFMRPFTDLLRQTIVLNPLFSLAQLPQDAYGAMFTSGLKQPFKIPVEIMKEFFKTLTGTSATREELRPYGVVGQRDYSAFASREDAKVAASMKKASLKDLFLKPFEMFANASDNAVRQAVYNRTLLETGGKRVGGKIFGGDKDAALEKAFEIINFRRAGSSPVVSAGRQLVPFFGAYLQAMNVAAKTISGKGISVQEKNAALAVLAGTATKVLVLSMMYSFLVGDDEGYEKLDPTVRNRRLVLPGTDGLSIPLRNDIFTLFTKILPENLIQRYAFEGIDDKKLMKSLKDATALAIIGPTPIPQAFTPILESAVNYDFFTGRPIIGQFEQQLEKELQYSQSTAEIARLFSDLTFNTVAPKTFDHLIKGYLGYTAGLISLSTNDLIAAGYGRERPSVSGRDFIASIPGMSMFVSREFGTKAQSDFYELRDEVQTAVASFNKLKAIDMPAAKEYMKEKKDLLKLKSAINSMGSSLSEIRREQTRVAESNMPPKQKQIRLKQLREMQERVYNKAGILREKAGF